MITGIVLLGIGIVLITVTSNIHRTQNQIYLSWITGIIIVAGTVVVILSLSGCQKSEKPLPLSSAHTNTSEVPKPLSSAPSSPSPQAAEPPLGLEPVESASVLEAPRPPYRKPENRAPALMAVGLGTQKTRSVRVGSPNFDILGTLRVAVATSLQEEGKEFNMKCDGAKTKCIATNGKCIGTFTLIYGVEHSCAFGFNEEEKGGFAFVSRNTLVIE